MIKFCTQCAAPAVLRVPDGDNRERSVCSRCGHIHYENPRLIVGCVLEWENAVLLCRRAIEPRHGFWTLPAGFMENGETVAEAAAREAHEEACAEAADLVPFAMASVGHIGQVHFFFRGQLVGGHCEAGEESLEVRLFQEEEIPWKDMAFRSGTFCLKRYFEDRRRNAFGFHSIDMTPM